MRRKLDDVAAKLDILYNKLRQSVLSAATLQGLHTILQHVWQYDYPACMQVWSRERTVVISICIFVVIRDITSSVPK